MVLGAGETPTPFLIFGLATENEKLEIPLPDWDHLVIFISVIVLGWAGLDWTIVTFNDQLKSMKKLVPWQKAIFVSVSGIILYQLGLWYPLPLISEDFSSNFSSLPSSHFGFFHLGTGALLTGFFVVEMMTFVIPALRKWKFMGVIGRQKLNKASLILSLVVGLWQAYQLVDFLSHSADTSGASLLGDFTALTQLFSITFFLAGIWVVYILGQWMTKFGLGNGFGTLLFFYSLVSVSSNILGYIDQVQISLEKPNYPGFLFLVIFYAFLVRYLKREDSIMVHYQSTSFAVKLPSLPQGIFSLRFTSDLVLLPASIVTLTSLDFDVLKENSWSFALAFLFLMPITGVLGYYLCYSPRQIILNIERRIDINIASLNQSKRHFIIGLVVVTLVGFLLLIPQPFNAKNQLVPSVLSLFQFLIIYFVGKDIISHFRFLFKHDQVSTLGEFDNIHLMMVSKALLRHHGIESHVQGFELRQIYAFFNPLYKMQLYVKKMDLKLASSLLNLEGEKII